WGYFAPLHRHRNQVNYVICTFFHIFSHSKPYPLPVMPSRDWAMANTIRDPVVVLALRAPYRPSWCVCCSSQFALPLWLGVPPFIMKGQAESGAPSVLLDSAIFFSAQQKFGISAKK